MNSLVTYLLEKAKARIQDRNCWAQGIAWAKNSAGEQVIPAYKDAVAWTIVGAIAKEEEDFRAVKDNKMRQSIDPNTGYFLSAGSALDQVIKAKDKDHWSLYEFNDKSTHEEIMQAFDEAIVYAKSLEEK